MKWQLPPGLSQMMSTIVRGTSQITSPHGAIRQVCPLRFTLFTRPPIYLHLDALSLRLKRHRRQKRPAAPTAEPAPPLEDTT